MDSMAFALVQRAEEQELNRHLERARMAREIAAERRRLTGARTEQASAPHRASRPRRRLLDIVRTARRPVRLA